MSAGTAGCRHHGATSNANTDGSRSDASAPALGREDNRGFAHGREQPIEPDEDQAICSAQPEPCWRRPLQHDKLLAEKCCFGLASRMRSEQSDEQSAEQLQEVKHPEARITHRGICASPDTIFGSHRARRGSREPVSPSQSPLRSSFVNPGLRWPFAVELLVITPRSTRTHEPMKGSSALGQMREIRSWRQRPLRRTLRTPSSAACRPARRSPSSWSPLSPRRTPSSAALQHLRARRRRL